MSTTPSSPSLSLDATMPPAFTPAAEQALRGLLADIAGSCEGAIVDGFEGRVVMRSNAGEVTTRSFVLSTGERVILRLSVEPALTYCEICGADALGKRTIVSGKVHCQKCLRSVVYQLD